MVTVHPRTESVDYAGSNEQHFMSDSEVPDFLRDILSHYDSAAPRGYSAIHIRFGGGGSVRDEVA
jgi:hypothetical protein